MRRSYCIIDTLAVFATFIALVPDTVAEDVYLGLNTTEIFSRCGIEIERSSFWSQPGAPCASVGYDFGESVYTSGTDKPIGYRERVSVAVYPQVEKARDALKNIRNVLPILPPPPAPGELIGDDMIGEGSGHRVIFRRRNIVIDLMRTGSETAGSDFARQIDNWIQNDRTIAPLGTFNPPPEIVDAGIPATLTVRPMVRRMLNERPLPFVEPARSVLRINPQFRGLGPPEKIRLSVTIEGLGTNQVGPDGLSREHVAVPEGDHSTMREKSAENDGRFLVELHRLPSEATTRKVTLVAASEDNVIVTKEVQVQIVPAE